jgi:hypothetical protein
MTPTITSTLAALSNVGNTPVTLRLSSEMYSLDAARRAATRHDPVVSVDATGELSLQAVGDDAWRTFREFAQDLLATALKAE